MLRRNVFLVGLLMMVLQLAAPESAWARWVVVTATAVCDTGTGAVAINYTSTSWTNDPVIGENSQVDILFNGIKVASGAYVYPGNAFSGSASAPPGEQVTVQAIAAASWGNGSAGGQSDSVTVTIPTGCEQVAGTGRMTGGGSQIRVDGVRVTRGLTIHCDLLLSNNLEVNWGGNKFHMTEHIQTVRCSDDPEIIQFPPEAPLDTLVGTGTGRYNNVAGYTIEFTFVDAGEPGSADKASLRIYETANPANVVLNVPLQLLSGGNLQAHYDQPHQ